MKLNRKNAQKALTLIEVLVVVAVFALIAVLLLPGLARTHSGPSPRSRCISNLKQDGLAFRQWALDHNGQYPMSVSTADGGTKEFVSKGGVYFHFVVLSNELNTPKILHCPKDEGHKPATTFTNGFTEANISYFVGVDASQTNTNMFLTGDRNLTNGTLLPNGILELKSSSAAGWTKKIHELQGNVGLADGSVQSFSTSKVREALNNTGVATNRLAMP